MIPEEVAVIRDILMDSYEMSPALAIRDARDIYNEFKLRLLPECMSIV